MGDYIVIQSFVVKSVWDSANKESFIEDLSIEIQDNSSSIGLDEYFRYGGAIDDVCVEDLEITEISPSGIIHGNFCITFSESYSSGCRDISWSDTYSGTMLFVLDINTRELTIVDEEISLVEVSDDEDEK